MSDGLEAVLLVAACPEIDCARPRRLLGVRQTASACCRGSRFLTAVKRIGRQRAVCPSRESLSARYRIDSCARRRACIAVGQVHMIFDQRRRVGVALGQNAASRRRRACFRLKPRDVVQETAGNQQRLVDRNALRPQKPHDFQGDRCRPARCALMMFVGHVVFIASG